MTAPLDETGAVVARVRDALDGVPDDTTLYARGMKLTGWRHEVTAGEVRALIARVDAVTAERDRYKAALAKYGAHDSDCTFRFGMNPELFPCTCGLDAAKESR